MVEESFSSNLGGDGDTKRNPGKLEGIAKDIEVPSREDGGDRGGVGDCGSTCAILYQHHVFIISDTLWRGRGSSQHIRGLFHDRSSEKKE